MVCLTYSLCQQRVCLYVLRATAKVKGKVRRVNQDVASDDLWKTLSQISKQTREIPRCNKRVLSVFRTRVETDGDPQLH